jgi:hypothetical protein
MSLSSGTAPPDQMDGSVRWTLTVGQFIRADK